MPANYRKPLSLGTAEALYFEDNEAHFGPEVVNPTGNNPWIVPSNGARTVIRHNKIINSQLEIYRPGMSQGVYGTQSVEIYDNAFSAVGLNNYRPQCFITIGAGVAIVFNNTVTGTTYNCREIELRNERALRDLPGFPMADGKNPLDGNQIPAGQVGARLSVLRPGWLGNERRRRSMHRRPVMHGTTPSMGRRSAWKRAAGGGERSRDDQGRPGFFQ